MDCRRARKWIAAYQEDLLGDGLRREFVEHMRHCKPCREELERARALEQAWRNLPENKAPDNLREKIMSAVRRDAARTGKFAFMEGFPMRLMPSNISSIIRWAAAAAAVLVFICLFFWILRPQSFERTGARLIAVQGHAEWISPDSNSRIARSGDPFTAGLALHTEEGGRAELVAGGTKLVVESSTRLRPKGDALEGFFYLEEGKVTVFHTHGPLCIATPNARAYPIGTAFSVSFKTGKTTVLVLEGKVALEGKELPEERVIIEKGETGVLAGAKPPEKSGGAAMPYPESSEENTPWNNETQPGEIQYQ